MKNRWFPIVAFIIIIVALISTGCGVSRSEYDAVTVELNLLKEDRQELQTELHQAQSQLSNAMTDLVRAEVELETTQSQLEETQTDLESVRGQLQNATAQVQSIQNELDAARSIPALALSYAEFMDIVMYEVWVVAGVTPNFVFSTAGEYQTALKNQAESIGDPQLNNFVSEIEAGPVTKDRLYEMCYYCLDKLESILK
jgi:ATP/maltotriose-dependent transcriptional regulator MalT